MSTDVNTAKLEQLLLEELSAAEQLASVKITLDRLMNKVDEFAATDTQQVRSSTGTIAKRLANLREVPAQLLVGNSAKSAKLEKKASSKINEECDLIEKELETLERLEIGISQIKNVVRSTLTTVMKAKVWQDGQVASPTVQGGYESECDGCETQLSDVFHAQDFHHKSAGDGTTNPLIVYEQLNRSEFDNVEYHLNFDPAAAAQGRSLHTTGRPNNCKGDFQPERTTELRPRREDSSRSLSTQCPNQGESRPWKGSIASIFEAMALPEVVVFKDPQGKRFDEFIMRFTMKYLNLALHNDLLNQLLLSKLEGYPKAVARALPRHVREGDFDSLVETLRLKFKTNDSAMQMKAYMDLKRLRKAEDLTGYCPELERLTREAYPDASEEELSRTRAGELVSQLTDWPEYFQLYTTMEIAPKELAYDMVKTMAQRCERSKEVAAAMRDNPEGYIRNRQEGGKRQASPTYRASNTHSSTLASEGTSCKSKGRAQARTDPPRPVKCYHCNKRGHLKRDCTLLNKQSAKGNAVKQDQQVKAAKILTATLQKWVCGAVKVENESELVGKQTTTEVQLLGMSRRALLDTGSQISITTAHAANSLR